MTCKGCGNRIPEKYLRLDSFKCPSCGKPYKRIASHHTSKPISAPRRDESLHASGMSRSSSQKAPVESKHKLSIAAFMFLLGIIFVIIGTVIGGAAPAILIPLGVSLICFGIVIAYFTSQKSGASKSKGTGTTCHSHVIGNRTKPFVISIIVLVIILVAIGIAAIIRSKTSRSMSDHTASDVFLPTATTQPEIENGDPFTLAANATFGAGKYQIEGNGSYEIEFSLDNMWDEEMMVFRFNSKIAEYCQALLQTDRYSETPYSDIEFVGIATVIDLYGNESVQPVARASLDMPTIEKINWENFNYDNLQQVCQKYILTAALE